MTRSPTEIPTRYELRRVLGEGGMGQVLQVYDRSREEVVALKLLNTPRVDPAALDRFRAEFRTLAQLRHPNLVSVYDFGYTADDVPYFTMTFVPGRELLAAAPRLPVEGLTEVVVQVCRALAYIHSRGLIHGDVKPANILVAETPEGPQVRLTDFGLAQEQVVAGGLRLRGTVGYVAPEVIRGDPVDGRADLYALGCSLYQVLTGRLPFAGAAPGEVLQAHLDRTPEPPRRIAPDVPAALESVTLRLLAKEPTRRYPSANAVIEAINEKTGADYAVETAETRASYVQSGRFVGREAELERLWSLLEDCIAPLSEKPVVTTVVATVVATVVTTVVTTSVVPGTAVAATTHTCVALIGGESGVGKTRLMRELRLRGQLAGVPFLSGACAPDGEAYRPFVEILRGALPLAEDDSSSVERHAGALSRLLPGASLPMPAGDWPLLEPEAERLRLLDEVSRFLVELAGKRPFVLTVEDLHWADEGTVALLAHLARLASAHRLLICATYRTDEAGPFLAARVADLRQEGRLEEITLHSLDEGQAASLVASMFGLTALPARWQAELKQVTGGNPYFIEEWLKGLAEEGGVTYAAGTWQLAGHGLTGVAVPAGAAEAVARRLAKLEPTELEILRALSVFEGTVPVEVLLQVTSMAEGDLGEGLKLVERRGFMRRENGRCGFHHDTARWVVYAELPETQRRALHAAAATALEMHYGPEGEAHVEELAHHFLRGADREPALSYGRRAAERSQRVYAHDRAISFYEAVLAWLQAEQGAERASVFEVLGGLHHIVGAYDRAIGCYEAALEAGGDNLSPRDVARLHERIGYNFMERHDNEAALEQYQAGLAALGEAGRHSAEGAAILSNLGRLHKRAGRFDPGLAACLEAAEVLEQFGDSRQLVEVYHILQGFYRDRGEWERFSACLEKTLAMAGRLDDRVGRTMALSNLAIGVYMQGRREEAIGYWEEALQLSRKIGHLLTAAATANNLGIACLDQGAYQRSAAYFEEALTRVEPLGGLFNRGLILGNLGEVYSTQAAYGRAIEALEEAMDCYERAGDHSMMADFLNQMGLIWMALGRPEQARDVLERALAMARQHEDQLGEGYGYLWLGRETLAREAWADAESHLSQALALFEELGVPAEIATARLALAELACRQEDVQVARQGGRDVLAQAEALAALRVQVEAHLLLGRLEEGAAGFKHLQAAAELAEEMPELRWRAHHSMGRWHHQADHRAEAARHYGMARDILKALVEAVPEAYRSTYLAAPDRQRFRADVAELLTQE